jgi:hypothetical protein
MDSENLLIKEIKQNKIVIKFIFTQKYLLIDIFN